MHLILRWIINAAVLMLITELLSSVQIDNFATALIAALVIGLVNALLRPLAIIVTLPINILTLGLFTFVINALLFLLAAELVPGFQVAGFWAAFWGALLYSLISSVISALILERKHD
jgi:putative membrane protein